jgi:hypothetical protein
MNVWLPGASRGLTLYLLKASEDSVDLCVGYELATPGLREAFQHVRKVRGSIFSGESSVIPSAYALLIRREATIASIPESFATGEVPAATRQIFPT